LITDGHGRDDYKSLMRTWVWLGTPAFTAVLVIFFLMVSKLGAYG